MRLSLKVPTEWNDITLEQYQTFVSLPQDTSEEQTQLKLVEIFCGIDSLSVRDIPHATLDNIVGKITNVLNQEPQFVSRFKLYETEYGFHPNLHEMTFGEFIDLEEWQGKPDQLHKLAGVLFRPIDRKFGSRYSIEPYNPNQEEWDRLKRMPCGVFLASQVFFWRLGTHLSSSILKSLEAQADPSEQKKLSSSKSGGGIQQSIDYATEILRECLKSQAYPFNKRFNSLLIKATKTNSKDD